MLSNVSFDRGPITIFHVLKVPGNKILSKTVQHFLSEI